MFFYFKLVRLMIVSVREFAIMSKAGHCFTSFHLLIMGADRSTRPRGRPSTARSFFGRIVDEAKLGNGSTSNSGIVLLLFTKILVSHAACYDRRCSRDRQTWARQCSSLMSCHRYCVTLLYCRHRIDVGRTSQVCAPQYLDIVQ